MRGHGHLAKALVELSTRIGMSADAERYIPELYEKLSSLSDEMRVKKAIMDVVIGVPGLESLLLVDVSIRSAAAAHFAADRKSAT